MFTIGEFARHGRVSARMLRHYDAIGLLRPDRIDPATGYRYYGAAQLARLNRVIALKDLGFTLQQVRAVVDDQVDADELRGMLRLRRAELEAAMTAAAARLTQVEARLRSIESEGHMPENDVQIKRVPAVRVAEVTSTAPGYQPQDISPVVGPLYEKLFPLLATAGSAPPVPASPGTRTVRTATDRSSSTPAVTVDAPAGPLGDTGVTVVELPAFEAATIVHRGSMDHVLATEQILARWIEDHGRRPAGYSREVSLECPEDREMWVTELQLPLVG